MNKADLIMQRVDSLVACINEAHRAKSEEWRDGCFAAADYELEEIERLVRDPVVGEVTDDAIWRIAQMPECHHGGDFAHSVDPIPFARALLATYAAPQASLSQQVEDARARVALWPKEKRDRMRLEGAEKPSNEE